MDTRQGALTVFGCAFALAALFNLFAFPSPVRAQANFMDPYYPYDAFDALPHTEVPVPGGGVIEVGIAPSEAKLPEKLVFDWIKLSAQAVSVYYGRFPVDSVRLLIVPAPGKGIGGGQAFGHRGAAIRVIVGSETTEAEFKDDWRLVHEMIHTALPRVRRRHSWLSEGLAVYVESIARAQAGHLKPEVIWRDFVRAMPKGLPQDGDEGLDNTPTWGRTYWGGAVFCLLADIEIRKRSNNAIGLQDALRGILAAGGNHEQRWDINRVLTAADETTGLDAITKLYDEMKDRPVSPDLDALWRRLGVTLKGDSVVFNDEAELAAIRRAITAPPKSPT